MVSILIASTDADYYLLLSHILSEAGFAVSLASSVVEVIQLSQQTNPAAVPAPTGPPVEPARG